MSFNDDWAARHRGRERPRRARAAPVPSLARRSRRRGAPDPGRSRAVRRALGARPLESLAGRPQLLPGPAFSLRARARLRGGRRTGHGVGPASADRNRGGGARRVHRVRAVGRARRAPRRVDGGGVRAADLLRRHARPVDPAGARACRLGGGRGPCAAGRTPRPLVGGLRSLCGVGRGRPRDQRAVRGGTGPLARRHPATRSPPEGRPRVRRPASCSRCRPWWRATWPSGCRRSRRRPRGR